MSRGAKFAIVFAVFFVVLFVMVLAVSLGNRLPQNSVLVLELGGQIEEIRPGGALAQLTGPGVTLMHNVLDGIEHAKTDDRITGLVVKITPLDIGWAKIEEIRARIADFRGSKKPTLCYLHGDIMGN
ncbi:MAG: hypothetical protein L0219_08070, partial [Phycisphaerales bacterium]|nr:hypothetical protein [Phycisphaerales bacterium]